MHLFLLASIDTPTRLSIATRRVFCSLSLAFSMPPRSLPLLPRATVPCLHATSPPSFFCIPVSGRIYSLSSACVCPPPASSFSSQIPSSLLRLFVASLFPVDTAPSSIPTPGRPRPRPRSVPSLAPPSTHHPPTTIYRHGPTHSSLHGRVHPVNPGSAMALFLRSAALRHPHRAFRLRRRRLGFVAHVPHAASCRPGCLSFWQHPVDSLAEPPQLAHQHCPLGLWPPQVSPRPSARCPPQDAFGLPKRNLGKSLWLLRGRRPPRRKRPHRQADLRKGCPARHQLYRHGHPGQLVPSRGSFGRLWCRGHLRLLPRYCSRYYFNHASSLSPDRWSWLGIFRAAELLPFSFWLGA
ncbi:uncharacterized protein BJ171DRAFT_41861 [Polychytrium aggregatum]|uniref:uncharacterized protein n=1 Tax=Polychytrium aggregatum TaxID=110093 RepID=UPI0022FDB2BF|nr:uncharacterized protein BJ171DRAFT_41861 [Polychytrium aggregatum]KAI9206138.1 hypothetical protein BJ171DRAFT_41861 [Polychytrium aggregatum]